MIYDVIDDGWQLMSVVVFRLCKVFTVLTISLVQATYITDFFVMYCLRKSRLYSKLKYHKLDEDKEDNFLILDDSLVDSVENYGTIDQESLGSVRGDHRERCVGVRSRKGGCGSGQGR